VIRTAGWILGTDRQIRRQRLFSSGRIWLAYAIVFVSSTCGLVIELVAGRIMAPYIGVSLYTWTSIIGVVLAGISLGNFLGGQIADRRASRPTLGLIFLAGSIATAGILVMTQIAMSVSATLDIVTRIVFYTTAIFFLPSLILGMVSPVVVKLALGDLTRTGNTVGTIYAFSTVGSIFGTFVTGFWLISWLGTRTIIWVVAGVLLAMAILVGEFWRPKGVLAALSGAAVLAAIGIVLNGQTDWVSSLGIPDLVQYTVPFALVIPVVIVAAVAGGPVSRAIAGVLGVAALFAITVGWTLGQYRAPCMVESNYYCIRISSATIDGKQVRSLVLDHLIHSYVLPEDPTFLGYGYERVYDELTTYHTQGRTQLDTLFIGGGGYTFPRYITSVYPSSTVDVMEIDPAVTQAAYEYLALPPETRVRTFNLDARTFLIQWPDPKKYDIVYGDAFNDLSVPYHLTTVEFDRIIYDRLKPDGMYMINVIDKYQGGEFMKAFMSSLRQVFPNVYLTSQGKAWEGTRSNTYILLATKTPFDQADFARVVAKNGVVRTDFAPSELVDAYLAAEPRILLTDDYAPVDQLVARLFVERGF
jgi:spermidine synthase